VVVSTSAEVQVHPAALPLRLIDLAFAVLLAAGLEGEQFRIPREPLQGGQQVAYCHALRVTAPARSVRPGSSAIGFSIPYLSC
jgi:hypothetical protein